MNTDNAVINTVLKTASEHDMFKSGDRVLAAVSGGADSVCMLDVLCRLADRLGIIVFCAHLNHGLRGEAADGDELFVKRLCRERKIRFFSKKTDVAAAAANRHMTVEEAGRHARYEFFDEVCRKHKIGKIATAHNKNDNAETVLMRIMRGTGTDGLAGIPYVRGCILRPLLNVGRHEIEDYCGEHGLEYRTDASNFENDYTRNKIRNELLPYLMREFNPNICDSLARLAENAGGDAQFMKAYAERLFARLGSPLPGGKPPSLHTESLGMLERPVAARVVRLAADRALPGVRLEKKHVDEVLSLIGMRTGAAVDLPEGLRAEVRYGWIVFENKNAADKRCIELSGADEFFEEIEIGGSCFIDALGREISLRAEDGGYKPKINEMTADFAMLDGKRLFLRSRRSGDRIVWFPDGRTKKIKNILIDSKIPKKDRGKIPLLCTGDEVVAIVGSRVSEKYKLHKNSERAVVIAYGTGKRA